MPKAEVAPDDVVLASRQQSGPWLPLLCSGLNLAGNLPLKLSLAGGLSEEGEKKGGGCHHHLQVTNIPCSSVFVVLVSYYPWFKRNEEDQTRG